MAKKAIKPPELELETNETDFPFQEEMLLAIFIGLITVNKLPRELFNYTFFSIMNQLELSVNKNSKLFAKIADNIAAFSANKTFQEVYAIQSLKNEAAIVTQSSFMESAKTIDKVFNKNWLEVEKDAAFKMGESAKQWEYIQETKELFPLLKYSTVRDNRVRESHAEQEGKIYPVDHPYWDTWMPINDWRCRCTVNQIAEGKITPGKWSPNDNPIFGINPGKTGIVFKETHPYFDVPKKFKKSQKNNFGLT